MLHNLISGTEFLNKLKVKNGDCSSYGKLDQVVMLLISILKVPSLNLSQVTNYPDIFIKQTTKELGDVYRSPPALQGVEHCLACR
jgi:hypothetical protein